MKLVISKRNMLGFGSAIFASLSAGYGPALAEENINLVQPDYVGSVTGNDEKDTFGVEYTTRTQYFILMHQGCSYGLCDAVTTGSTGSQDFVGNVGVDDERNTFGFVRQVGTRNPHPSVVRKMSTLNPHQ